MPGSEDDAAARVRARMPDRGLMDWPRQIRKLQDVIAWDLCSGCGACYYACPTGVVSLVDIASAGTRPSFSPEGCGSCVNCLSICPGFRVDGEPAADASSKERDAADELGPYLEIWEGFATDPEIRFKASSGGVLSALSLYCLEREDMEFVLHAGMDESKPWTNKTVQSRSRDDILKRTGSRYAPASPCDGLKAIEESPRPCVFIGKPCDAEAVAMLRQQRPELEQKLGIVLTFFCAGTPNSQGTMDLLDSLDVVPNTISSVRYRGEGWPGGFKVQFKDRADEKFIPYEASWGKLTRYRNLRCHLCPDGLGQVADISCGDAWHQFNSNSDIGRSIVIVRTRRGQEILRRAWSENYVELRAIGPEAVRLAQPGLLERHRELFGRLFARRLFLAPSPQFRGFFLLRNWLRLGLVRKLRTVMGTARRIVLRGLWRQSSLH